MFYNTFPTNFNHRVLMEASENRALPTELGHRKPHIGYKQMTPTEFMNHLQTNYSSGGASCL